MDRRSGDLPHSRHQTVQSFRGEYIFPLEASFSSECAFKEEQNDDIAIIAELQTLTDTAQEENDQPAIQ